MDDPKVSIILIIDSPKGEKSGSLTATPAVKGILENTLRYMNIQPSYSKEDLQTMQSKMTTVPDVTNINFRKAADILTKLSLKYTVTPALIDGEDFMVVDQYPKTGEKIAKDGTVCLYKK